MQAYTVDMAHTYVLLKLCMYVKCRSYMYFIHSMHVTLYCIKHSMVGGPCIICGLSCMVG